MSIGARINNVMGEAGSILGRYAGEGGAGRLVDQLRTNRHMLRFGATQVLHPFRLKTGVRAYADALARQDVLFSAQRIDDVTDAMRHVGASALVVDRLVQRGTKPSVAGEFMRRVGIAHEMDSGLTGMHRIFSEQMDLHNNELGIELALQHAAAGASSRGAEQALEGAALRAIADGRAVVLDAPTTPPRPSTMDELRAVLRDPSMLD